jgi:hypothetical protein
VNYHAEEIWSQDMANVQLGPEVRVHRMNDPGTYCTMRLIPGEAHWPCPLQSVASKPYSSECQRVPLLNPVVAYIWMRYMIVEPILGCASF